MQLDSAMVFFDAAVLEGAEVRDDDNILTVALPGGSVGIYRRQLSGWQVKVRVDVFDAGNPGTARTVFFGTVTEPMREFWAAAAELALKQSEKLRKADFHRAVQAFLNAAGVESPEDYEPSAMAMEPDRQSHGQTAAGISNRQDAPGVDDKFPA